MAVKPQVSGRKRACFACFDSYRDLSPCDQLSTEPLQQVIAYAQGVGHDSQRRIHRAARREEATVDDIEIVEIVRLAVHIERRAPWIAAEADRPALMGGAADRDILAEIERVRQDNGSQSIPCSISLSFAARRTCPSMLFSVK